MNCEHNIIIKNDNEVIPAACTKIVEVQLNNEDLHVLTINSDQAQDICLPARVVGRTKSNRNPTEEKNETSSRNHCRYG